MPSSSSSTEEGLFEYKEGVLSAAIKNGYWIILYDAEAEDQLVNLALEALSNLVTPPMMHRQQEPQQITQKNTHYLNGPAN